MVRCSHLSKKLFTPQFYVPEADNTSYTNIFLFYSEFSALYLYILRLFTLINVIISIINRWYILRSKTIWEGDIFWEIIVILDQINSFRPIQISGDIMKI